MDDLPFKVALRVPVNEERVRLRAYRLHKERPERCAFDNWIDAEADEMAAEFAARWPLRILTPAMDLAFRQLYFESIRSHINWLDFEQTTSTFLDSEASDRGKLNDYFSNFTGLWTTLLHMQRTAAANGLWERAVNCVSTWERKRGRTAHKGAGLYFWGINCILTGDLLRGFTLVHESLQEDGVIGGTMPDTPAAAVATLNYEKHDQPALMRTWLKAFATVFIESTVRKTGSGLSVGDLRRRFLMSTNSWSQTFLLVYTLAALRHVHEHPALYRTSDFSGQVALDLFFNITLVIERAIGDKNSTKYTYPNGNPRAATFIDQAEYLAAHAPLGTTRQQLGEANGRFSKAFDATLRSVLDGTFAFSDGTLLASRDRHLLAAYGIRNRGGHETDAPPVVWQRFDDVLIALMSTLLLATETFY